MNIIVKWAVKKYVLNIVNGAIDKYNRNISVARAYVTAYIGKIEAFLAFLKSLDAKLADGKITEEEVDAIVDEASKLGESLAA